MSTDAAEIIVEERPGILVITVNRPWAHNAMTQAVAERIAEAVDLLDARADLRVGILTGAGRSFCAGMDLKGFVDGQIPEVPGRGFAGITRRPPRTPIIAAVEGWALGGGCEMVMSCDLVVAARGARLGLPEVKRGLIAAGGGLLMLPQRIPRAIAMEMALTGDPITAERGYELGLVNLLTDDGNALTAALELAERIAANGPLAVAASKQIIAEAPDWPPAERWAEQDTIWQPVADSEDIQEGTRAFAEKRAPVWKGR